LANAPFVVVEAFDVASGVLAVLDVVDFISVEGFGVFLTYFQRREAPVFEVKPFE
jgi:hypothetical protein